MRRGGEGPRYFTLLHAMISLIYLSYSYHRLSGSDSYTIGEEWRLSLDGCLKNTPAKETGEKFVATTIKTFGVHNVNERSPRHTNIHCVGITKESPRERFQDSSI